MTYPTNPTNGQQANINGVVYTYNSTRGVWAVTTTFSGNALVNQINANSVVSAGNVSGTNFNGGTVSVTGAVTAASVSATSVSATSFAGGGSQLTGVIATQLANGNSNVSISSSGGNVTTAVGGNVITTVTSTGLQSQFVTSPRTISANATIGGTINASSVGPITIANGVVVTVADGGEWSIV